MHFAYLNCTIQIYKLESAFCKNEKYINLILLNNLTKTQTRFQPALRNLIKRQNLNCLVLMNKTRPVYSIHGFLQ